MASFWRGSRESRGRDAALKQALTSNLSECVKAIQFNQQMDEGCCQTLGSDDQSNALCCAIEAIFIHGLQETFFRKAKSAFTGDIDHKPEPNFWPILLILSHRDNIQQISNFKQITTEIGQCRSWIRIALNDGLLSSYLSTLMRNMKASKPYYSHAAYIRDTELLDVARRLLEGIELCTQFRLPVNSSLLNVWSEDVLMLAGIWTPTMRSCPVAPGVDVASTINEIENKKKMYIPGKELSGIGHMLAMDQDEALNYILSNTPENFIHDVKTSNNEIPNEPGPSNVNQPEQKNTESNIVAEEQKTDDTNNENIDDSDIKIEYEEPLSRPELNAMGNSITGKTTWSSDYNKEIDIDVPPDYDSKIISSLVDDSSVNTTNIKPINIKDVINSLHKELKLNEDFDNKDQLLEEIPVTNDDPLLSGLGFEVISKSSSNYFNNQELQKLMANIGTLSREYGLDSQDYQCINCNDMLGTTVSKAKVCAFTGQYFCSLCMDPNVFMIPARVIHNWDFYRYPVSKRAATFLLEFQHHPLINMKKFNPLIYTGVKHMAQLQVLRIQLNFLRAYLFTCREPVIKELQKRVWPREHLYEHVHIYSISDLAQISNGLLASQLEKIVAFAKSHVNDCWLCSQKGFICEVCESPKILYPFDIETTYRCESCSSVFHSKCLNSLMPCPKCERKKKRQGKSLVDAVHTNFQ